LAAFARPDLIAEHIIAQKQAASGAAAKATAAKEK
jgi:hypothetical protein